MFEPSRFGSSIAFVEGDRSWSYAELSDSAASISQAVGRRTLVCVVCSNTAECIAGYVGMIDAHIVPWLVGADLDEQLFKNLMGIYRPTHIWAPQVFSEKLEDYAQTFELGGYALFAAKASEPVELYDDLALLMSTSGSTGTPKLVRLSYENLRSNTESIIAYLGITQTERAITSLPLHYVYGLSVVNTHLYAGACLVLTELACYSGPFWKLFSAQNCTSFAGVPFMYEMLDKLKVTNKPAQPTLKTMTQAGGKLSPALQAKFTDFARRENFKFVVMYGASEATARMGYLPFEAAADKQGSMGIAIPGGRFELVDADGTPIETTRTPGELIYYGPNVSLGYAIAREDLAKGDENAGRLATGDIAERDEDGFYYVVGRLKRFVKMLGKRMNLDDVERLLKEELATVELACAGSDDLLRVFVTDAALTDTAKSIIVERLNINPRMCEINVIDEIPKSSSGKTLYAQLQ